MKRRLTPYLDGALSGERAEAVASHLRGCVQCRGEVSRLERLRGFLRSTFTVGPDPDWSGFWDGVRGRIGSERPRPWRQAWGWSPRLALGGALAAMLLVAGLFWQSGLETPPARIPVTVVNSVETGHPDGNVLVFSSPEDEMTVVEVFGLERPADDETRIVPVSVDGGRV